MSSMSFTLSRVEHCPGLTFSQFAFQSGASFVDFFYVMCVWLCYAAKSVSRSHVVTCCERVYLLALLCVMFSCVVTSPYVVQGKVWYLIVSIPDICLLPYFAPVYSLEIVKLTLHNLVDIKWFNWPYIITVGKIPGWSMTDNFSAIIGSLYHRIIPKLLWHFTKTKGNKKFLSSLKHL